MPISTVKIPTSAPIGTTARARPMFQRKLLTRTQSFAMVVIAVLARLALAQQVIVIADFLLIRAFEKPLLGAILRVWQVGVDAFVVSVQENVFAIRVFGRCDVHVSLPRVGFADGGP